MARTASKTDQPAQEARDALRRLTDENALLRAALAEARAQLGDAEENAGRDPLMFDSSGLFPSLITGGIGLLYWKA